MTRWTPICIALLVGILGIGLFIYGSVIPKYTNEEEYYSQLSDYTNTTYSDYNAIESGSASTGYYNIRHKYLTNAFIIEDIGISLFVLAIVTAGLFFTFRLQKRPVKTPRIAALYILANLTIIGAVIIAAIRIYIDQYRQEYPPWADSIAIPIFGFAIIAFLLMIPMNAAILGLGFAYRHTVITHHFITNHTADPHFIRRIVLALITLIFGAITLVSLAYGAYDQVFFGFLGGITTFALFYGILYRNTTSTSQSRTKHVLK